MMEIQKIIKYIAIAFGLFLSISIISSILFGAMTIIGIGTGIEYMASSENIEGSSYTQEFEQVDSIKIDTSISKLNIKTGDVLKVEGKNVSNQCKIQKEGDTLVIQDKKVYQPLWKDDQYPEITLYIPENLTLEKVEIATGVSETIMERLQAKKIELELGVGNTQINQIKADKIKLEGGAGKLVILDGDLQEADIDCGVGSFEYTGILKGKNDIDCGVGKTLVTLTDGKENYQIKAETGIGGLYIDNKSVADETVYGEGESRINIEAGVGRVDVNFKEETI